MRPRRLASLLGALALAACATASPTPPSPVAYDRSWTPAEAATRPVGLGVPGGARLAAGVGFAGGIQLVVDPASPLHGLSDLKLAGDEFYGVSDAGDLVRGRLRLDGRGRLVGLTSLAWRRLTLADGRPIVDKADGDAEGLIVTHDGQLLVSFERDHRIWNYGPAEAPRAVPTAMPAPRFAFALNDGMEAISATGE